MLSMLGLGEGVSAQFVGAKALVRLAWRATYRHPYMSHLCNFVQAPVYFMWHMDYSHDHLRVEDPQMDFTQGALIVLF